MDAIVEAALRKWPNVPHCWGWLALDARGDWYMRDERIQRAGPFPRVKGSRIEHEKLLAFIHRNYGCDGDGAWFFQNGPQRVYVQLEAAPWIWRLAPADSATPFAVAGHTGADGGAVEDGWLDERGRLFLRTTLGTGLVHSQDMALAVEALEHGAWPALPAGADTLPVRPFAEQPARCGYRLDPQAAAPR
jgi:hypothetical protein